MICSEELNRPENTDLKPIVDRLKSVKAKIEEKTKDSKLLSGSRANILCILLPAQLYELVHVSRSYCEYRADI